MVIRRELDRFDNGTTAHSNLTLLVAKIAHEKSRISLYSNFEITI